MNAHLIPSTHAAKADARMGGRWAMHSDGVRGPSAPRGGIPAGMAVLQ
jgi:hypothetical protein